MSTVRPRPRHLVAAGAAVLLLAAGSTVAIAAAGGAFRHAWVPPNGLCSAPALPGTVVDVELADMGPMASMMGGWGGMRVLADRADVPAGTVSLRVADVGSLVHELVVLPLPDGQEVGRRVIGADGRVAERGTPGEASRTCGPGTGNGIEPGAIGWVTLTLRPGNYELVCNEPGHYAGGMYTRLTVS